MNILKKTATRVLSEVAKWLAWRSIRLLEWSPRREIVTKLWTVVTDEDRHGRLDEDRHGRF